MLTWNFPGFTATAELLPAVLTDSTTYGFLNSDLGYLIANSLSGVEYLLYYGPYQYYDPSFIALDYAARGTITIGEALTGALGISVAEEYTGSVLVLNGNQDGKSIFSKLYFLPMCLVIDVPLGWIRVQILLARQSFNPNWIVWGKYWSQDMGV